MLKSLTSPGRISPSCRWWLLASLSLLVIVVLLCILVLLPAGVRALPGRYAARLPGFLQDLRHRPHPDILPTPAITVTPLTLLMPTPTTPHLGGITLATVTPFSETHKPIEIENTSVQEIKKSPAPTHTPTLPPTPTPTPAPPPTHTPTPSPTHTPTSIPISISIPPPITHVYQTWNNCGPATLSMALAHLHRPETQADAAAFLKPDPEDKNVNPYEMAAYARLLGLEATVRVGGDLPRLKRLIAEGFAVLVETWFIPEPGDQMGHYRLLTGYDDDARQFITQDSYNGPNVRLDYAALDELWRVFNRVYLIVYSPAQASQLSAILGEDVNDQTMYARALEIAQAEALSPSADCVAYEDCADGAAFAWFNVGSSLTALGRHQEAVAAYDQARLLGLPWRMLWYQFGPYESYYVVGRYDDVITLATVTLNTTDNLEESYYWRGRTYLAQGETDRARADFESALKYNPNFIAAAEALDKLE